MTDIVERLLENAAWHASHERLGTARLENNVAGEIMSLRERILILEDMNKSANGHIGELSDQLATAMKPKEQETEVHGFKVVLNASIPKDILEIRFPDGNVMSYKCQPAYLVPESIPKGIYWIAEAQNFYDQFTRGGMGDDFYMKWRMRRREFPVTPIDGFASK